MSARKDFLERARAELDSLKEALESFPASDISTLIRMAETICAAILKGKTLYTCGNGGSAADAQHIAGELVGKFRRKLRGFRAVALTSNSSIVTAVANDFGFEEIFSRQIESLGSRGDVLLALSTSGSSENVILAVEKAKSMGMRTLAFSGKDGGNLASASHLAIVIHHGDFARIQEMHMALGHILCGIVEEMVIEKRGR